MSKGEFDQYLALLSGLLRLSPAQREAIASEMYDHLEERLGELLAQGVPRQKAIETALEEFGDAAGLAGEFAQIFQRQRRRWMMRMTFGTAAVISAIVLVTSAFWPDGHSGPSPRRLAAQDEPKAAASQVPLFSPTLGDADLRVQAILQKRIEVDYIDQPFKDILDDLGVTLDLQFYVKTQMLEEFGIDTSVPITIGLKDVPLEMVLELILEDRGLTYVMHNGVILVTTTADSESLAEVRVYNCRDLLETHVASSEPFGPRPDAEPHGVVPQPAPIHNSANPEPTKSELGKSKPGGDESGLLANSRHFLAQFGGGGGGMAVPQLARSREEQLIDIIQTAVMPESWQAVGGPGTIGEFDGMIVIRHNPRVHRQVEQVLHMLRDASAQQGWENPGDRGGFGTGGGGGFF